jgi:hypothetical protein
VICEIAAEFGRPTASHMASSVLVANILERYITLLKWMIKERGAHL